MGLSNVKSAILLIGGEQKGNYQQNLDKHNPKKNYEVVEIKAKF